MAFSRRTGIEIIERILALSQNGAKKTELLYKGNFSYTQLSNYLMLLIDKNLVEEKRILINGNPCKIYEITDKGENFLQDIQKILERLS